MGANSIIAKQEWRESGEGNVWRVNSRRKLRKTFNGETLQNTRRETRSSRFNYELSRRNERARKCM